MTSPPSPGSSQAAPLLWIGERDPARLHWVSPNLATSFGHPLGDWREPDFLRRLVDPRDFPNLQEAWRGVASTGTPETVDFRAVSARGALGSWTVDLSAIEPSAGAWQVLGALRTHHEREALIDSIDGIVWEADCSFRFRFVSRQAERLLGYPLRRWYDEPDFWVRHVHPDDRGWAPEYCRAAAEKGLPHEFEYRMIAVDGRVVWLRDIVTVVVQDGRVQGLRGIMVDVTAQHGVQERLERTVSLLEASFESTADGLLVVDSDGRITACNRRFQQIWGIPDALVDTHLDEPMLQAVRERLADPELFSARVQELYTHPDEESFETIALRDGRVLERYSLPQRLGGAIIGRVWSFRDVSLRVRAERERERLLREAHEAIQVRDDFLSIASHELKTPLTPLRLSLQVLRQLLESRQPGMLSRVDRALGQVRRLSSLVNDLLDASCVGVGRLELQRAPVSLRELALEVSSDFLAISDQHPITVDAPDEELLVLGDSGRLSQVLTNLMENALKYSPLGGAVHVSLVRDGADAVLSVADSGIGIPKEEQDHLFERFFRARNAPISGFGGLGMGLYICRDIVDRHDGHIWVESELGRGSTFHVSLPILATRTFMST
ncbi:sensor histidine kinase [Corallococcus llansteffanensis]|uniref:histidine kinase n=1 Tax=Corallococcus llansteffanensis TaxID=2316731 RepID=A0A3A8QAJ5_9BACT|nr:ATP-binding protein [Corallococcus llansteffanensis]RKH60304.1 PAS domain S-box protein [Corallococcus llansteffanensis]